MVRTSQLSLALILCTAFHLAHAEIYKCRSAKGKIIYSESPCEGMQSQPMEIIDNALDSSQLRREALRSMTERQESAPATSSTSTTTTITTKTETYQLMSEHDRLKRMSENMVTYNASTASAEKKQDAKYENSILNNEKVRVLSYDDNQLRSNLKVDLDNMSSAKRQRAAAELRALYTKY